MERLGNSFDSMAVDNKDEDSDGDEKMEAMPNGRRALNARWPRGSLNPRASARFPLFDDMLERRYAASAYGVRPPSLAEASVALELRRELKHILPAIRFPVMSKSEIREKVVPTGILMPNEIKEVMLYKAYQRHKHLFRDVAPPISFPTDFRVFVRQFTWDSDFDENGVIFYLGSNGRKAPFQNPLYNGSGVQVRTSRFARGEASCITSRQANRFWTSGSTLSEPAYVSIDLGEDHQLVPSCYTLMHGYRDGKDCLRCWTFEGSHDHKEWHILSLHDRDDSLQSGYSKKTFQVIPPTESALHDVLRFVQDQHFESMRNQSGYVVPGYHEWFPESKDDRDLNGEPIRDETAERQAREEAFKRLAKHTFPAKRKKYRYFRVRMFGPNSGGCGEKWYGWLTLCQIELYGTMYSFK